MLPQGLLRVYCPASCARSALCNACCGYPDIGPSRPHRRHRSAPPQEDRDLCHSSTPYGQQQDIRHREGKRPHFCCVFFVFFWLFLRWPFPGRVLRHRSLPGRGRRRRSLPAGVLRHRSLLHRYCWWSRRHVENNSTVVVEEVLAAHEASTAPFAGVRHGR